jgi:anti-anti-sigma factor
MTMSTSTVHIPRLTASWPSRLLSPTIRIPGSHTRRGSSQASQADLAQPDADTTPRARLSELAVTVRRDATSVVLTASGALDTYTVAAFRSVVERRDIACDDLVVDLDAVSLIDSAGLHTLRTLVNRAQASGHRLHLICRRADIRSALAIAGMQAIVTVAGTQPRARSGRADTDTTSIGHRGRLQTMRLRPPTPARRAGSRAGLRIAGATTAATGRNST